MAQDIYQQLAVFLDNLPGGFPATDSGVEIKILKHLFTEEEAELTLHLTLLNEPARVIAHRAKKPLKQVAAMLDQMEKKGLVYARHKPGKDPEYIATHFVVGIYEFQLNKLNEEFVGYFEEYLPQLLKPEVWKKAPLLRTIPVGESIEAEVTVLDYERAEELVHAHQRISVAPCVCRQEQEVLGHRCEKPIETCISFGSGADYYVRNEMGRYITQDEALQVLKLAEETGLVLQPDASRQATFICCCCGCCCGVLKTLKRHPIPADLAHTPFQAIHEDDLCDACELCLDRCQMEALQLDDGIIQIDLHRCIGCGLCVTSCPNQALSLLRKPATEQRYVPKTSVEKHLRLAKTRGIIKNHELASMFVKSRRDRVLTGKSK